MKKKKNLMEETLEDSFKVDKEWERITGQKTNPNRKIKGFNLSSLTQEEKGYIKKELGTTDEYLEEIRGWKLVEVRGTCSPDGKCFYMYNEK